MRPADGSALAERPQTGTGRPSDGHRQNPADSHRRQHGLVNMLDYPRVAQIAEEMGFEASARWVRKNRSLYSRAIFAGFEVMS